MILAAAVSTVLQSTVVPRAAIRYRDDLIREARAVAGMVAPVPMFAAQIHQESGYREDVCSAFACGLTQFTPTTATWISGVYKDLGPAAPLNPQWAIRAMVRYDQRLHDGVSTYDSECDRYQFALSAYNGGDGYRQRRQRASHKPGNYAVTSRINPNISAASQSENEQYAPRIVFRNQPVYLGWGGKPVCEVSP